MATASDIFTLFVSVDDVLPTMTVESEYERVEANSGEQWSVIFKYSVGRPAETEFSYTLTKASGGDPNAPTSLSATLFPNRPQQTIVRVQGRAPEPVGAHELLTGSIYGRAPTIAANTTYDGTVTIGS